MWTVYYILKSLYYTIYTIYTIYILLYVYIILKRLTWRPWSKENLVLILLYNCFRDRSIQDISRKQLWNDFLRLSFFLTDTFTVPNQHKQHDVSLNKIKLMYLPAQSKFWLNLQVKIMKLNVNRHPAWNWNCVITIHISWVAVWISRTCQWIVYHWPTFRNSQIFYCREKRVQISLI